MDAMIDLRLAELLCARLCHDLAGPVGAASAGAELFEDMGADADAETLALVAASAAGAAARLKFFRAAFGPSASGPQPAASLRESIESYLRTQVSGASAGTVLEWHTDAPGFDGETARLLLNLVLLAKDVLPRGGIVTVVADEASLTVAARGEASVLTDEARAVLLGGGEAAGPRGAQAMLAVGLARRRGTPVVVEFTSAGVAFSAKAETSPAGE
jgi:histidine phosphotransferase ChpT